MDQIFVVRLDGGLSSYIKADEVTIDYPKGLDCLRVVKNNQVVELEFDANITSIIQL